MNIGKLLCFLRLHSLVLTGRGPLHFANARCTRCQKEIVVNLWGTRS